MKRFTMVLGAAALCVAVASPAMAQRHAAAASAGSLRYGVSAGLLMPMGDYGDADKMGWVAGAGATYWLAGQPIGIRADLSYSQTSHDGFDGNFKILGGMASAVYALNPASAPARIMLTAGLGMYNVKESVSGESETKVGFGGGAAVAFKLGTGSTRLIVGTRYTSVSTSVKTNFVPITVGLSFGK